MSHYTIIKPGILEYHIDSLKDDDIPECKAIADANKSILGFLNVNIFREAARTKMGLVVMVDKTVVGFVLFRHRKRDYQTTLSDICIAEQWRGRGIGKSLVQCLVDDSRQNGKTFVQLKCPVGEPSNDFYQRIGFTLIDTVEGKKRNLNVWRYDIPEPRITPCL